MTDDSNRTTIRDSLYGTDHRMCCALCHEGDVLRSIFRKFILFCWSFVSSIQQNIFAITAEIFKIFYRLCAIKSDVVLL